MRRRLGRVQIAIALCAAPASASGVGLGIVRAEAATPIASPNLPGADVWIATGGGRIRVLDKQKAEAKVIDLKVGQSATFESLTLTLRACDVRPPSLPADAAGFLAVDDSRPSEPGFHGWMLADEPFVAMLESPTYGVRVVGCEKPTDAAVAAVTPPKVAPPPLAQSAGSAAAGDDATAGESDAGPASSEAPPPAAPQSQSQSQSNDGDQQDLSVPPPSSPPQD